tara:strand:+ start:2860 stop:3123 length:264 start_codon:yes stop_codon:yes gene_type:complete
MLKEEITYGTYKNKELALARADAVLMVLKKQTNIEVKGYAGGFTGGKMFLQYKKWNGGSWRVRPFFPFLELVALHFFHSLMVPIFNL